MRKKIKIYDIDYLMNACLTDEDLHYIFDLNSLLYSLVIGEFREINSTLTDNDILKLCKKNNQWMYENFWNKRQLNSFTNKLERVYKNVYNYGAQLCKEKAQWFIINYGLTNKSIRPDKVKTLCDY